MTLTLHVCLCVCVGALTLALPPRSTVCVIQTLTTAPVQPPSAHSTPAPITTPARTLQSAGDCPLPARQTSPSASADGTPHRYVHQAHEGTLNGPEGLNVFMWSLSVCPSIQEKAALMWNKNESFL